MIGIIRFMEAPMRDFRTLGSGFRVWNFGFKVMFEDCED